MLLAVAAFAGCSKEDKPDKLGIERGVVFEDYIGKEIPLSIENAYSEIFGYDTMELMNADIKVALEKQYEASEESYYEGKKAEYIEKIMEASEFDDLSKEIDTLTANEMAKEGKDFLSILQYFFQEAEQLPFSEREL